MALLPTSAKVYICGGVSESGGDAHDPFPLPPCYNGASKEVRITMLAIYCSAWDEGGAERWKLDNQEERGRRYALSINLPASECVVYRDVLADQGQKRPEYNRLRQDIADGKISEVWARDRVCLHPFGRCEKEAFENLSVEKGVSVSFGNQYRLG